MVKNYITINRMKFITEYEKIKKIDIIKILNNLKNEMFLDIFS